MKKVKQFATAAALVLSSFLSQASVISLDFETIATYPHSGSVFIQDFYNGGTSSIGSSGSDYGVSFSENSLLLCLNSTTITCSNSSRGGMAPGSAQGALFFLSGSASVMNIAAGFETGFSFNYASLSQAGSVSVFDEMNGTGNLLATIDLLPNAGSCPGYNAGYCPFSAVGILFNGIAKSVSFAGVANQIAFDDITFGAENPGPQVDVPTPASLGLFAVALLGLHLRRKTFDNNF